ncbi:MULTISPECIES: PEP-CTERM sorting domain-containing protein [unclassified Moorena]|uniref:PEP-CTERM sorting domain-containing protein n=1 Tax=unclassified Moorena TaxID=2683338 RepID=UPI0014007366|nr:MULTISPECIES: PEP-CTERM sorting domain-containing protein [unclassified Moorena]NEO16758.1 PEP-CTERM sorting domain-containing protein [Moorena sp. SIO3E8]NEP97515.1 PEP-CTERM sorting domain-containing protein [Moorena sp. SIO3F7]
MTKKLLTKLTVATTSLTLVTLGTTSSAQATSLTGLIEFLTNGSGSTGLAVWDTGADRDWDLFVTNDGEYGDFINDPTTRKIDFELTKGIHTFTIYGDGRSFLGNQSHYGLNLFFNGETTNPGISVFGALAQSTDSDPDFLPNSSGSTRGLDGSIVPGSGTLSFIDGLTTVTLTDYIYQAPNVQQKNRVSERSIGPNRYLDMVGEFTLNVETRNIDSKSVPEPVSVLGLLTVGAFGAGATLKRKKKQQA